MSEEIIVIKERKIPADYTLIFGGIGKRQILGVKRILENKNSNSFILETTEQIYHFPTKIIEEFYVTSNEYAHVRSIELALERGYEGKSICTCHNIIASLENLIKHKAELSIAVVLTDPEYLSLLLDK